MRKMSFAGGFLAMALIASPLIGYATPVQSVSNEVNASGLEEFARLSVTREQVTISPLLRWQIRSLIAMGTNSPPPRQAWAETRAFNTSVKEAARDFATHIWTYGDQIQYDENMAASEHEALDVESSVVSLRLGQNPNGKVDALMAAWIAAERGIPETGSASAFVDAMNLGRLSPAPLEHPFNAATVFSNRFTFVTPVPSTQTPTTLPFYRGNGVNGVRLDARHSMVSLYLFYGGSDPIRRFESVLPRIWNAISLAFAYRKLPAPNLPVSIFGSTMFDPNAGQAFGTWIAGAFGPSAIETFTLHADRFGVTIAAVAGIEGYSSSALAMLRPEEAPRPICRFSNSEPSVFVLADRQTGAIIAVAGNREDQL